ncbi:hypothetical protein LPJ61_000630 [Coemansia biformis]|uniref:L-2-hydroxyglutarate dehydrogenase, mitochondrial n=1 Tax=Coemansia biformis TaxID=1286918 RepID=A0A9W7YBF1_9FUNG|nr:hypothetical protein LPJ61_000630 [Coemansia biformis]
MPDAAARLAAWAADDTADVDYLVVGGGVVGLAVGRQLAARQGRSTLVVEKNRRFGMETSSRNSEVIHGGIYYPRNSLRTRLCIEGKRLLYAYCAQRRIPHRRVGKWVVAQNDEQAEHLHALARHCADLGVPAHLISRSRAAADEPSVRAHVALASPTTGIVDSHALMAALCQDLTDCGADYAPGAEAVALCRADRGSTGGGAGGYRALIATGDAATPFMAVRAAVVVNAAGLWADRIAHMLVPRDHPWRTLYRLHFAKGRYYMYTGGSVGARVAVRRLVYPVPDRHITSLGTHLTIDMAGAIRFGPDIEWIASNSDYATDGGPPIEQVAAAVAEYLPSIRASDLAPGYAGIRPKLQPPGGAFRDFVVREESSAGFPGFVNLIGIESPGLTSALAIARMVDRLLH